MSCTKFQGAAIIAAPAVPFAPTRPIIHDPDGLIALALELIDDNPFMTEFEALNRAVEMLDELDAFAADWDAYAAGSNPLVISLIETAA